MPAYAAQKIAPDGHTGFYGAVGYISPDRPLHMLLEDPQMRVLKRPTNICFGVSDRRTAFIGSLDGQCIPYFRVEHAGMALRCCISSRL
ncbi:MAG: hypothetical protein ACOCTS_00540 [Thermodesulfobacteriota bacterium]